MMPGYNAFDPDPDAHLGTQEPTQTRIRARAVLAPGEWKKSLKSIAEGQ